MQRMLCRFIKSVLIAEEHQTTSKPSYSSLFKYIHDKFAPALKAPINNALERYKATLDTYKSPKYSRDAVYKLRNIIVTSNFITNYNIELASKLLRDKKFRARAKYGILAASEHNNSFTIIDNEFINYTTVATSGLWMQVVQRRAVQQINDIEVIIVMNNVKYSLDREKLTRVAYIAKTFDEFEILIKRMAEEV